MRREKFVVTPVVIFFGVIGVILAWSYKRTIPIAEARTIVIVSSSPSKIIPKPSYKTVHMKITAYCPCEKCCGKDADGVTSRNKDAYITKGIAADPKLIPYNTILEIPNYGKFKVDDTGGAMRQSAKKGIYHIDFRNPGRFPPPSFSKKEKDDFLHREAKKFGVQWMDVKIYNP